MNNVRERKHGRGRWNKGKEVKDKMKWTIDGNHHGDRGCDL